MNLDKALELAQNAKRQMPDSAEVDDPTALHGYLGLRQDDGRTTSVIPALLAGVPSQVVQRRAGWAESNFQAIDYTERTYRVGGREVRLLVARSYDAKRLYHHPELAALRGFELTVRASRGWLRVPMCPCTC